MLKQEARFMANSFGFDSICEFFSTAFRFHELHLIAPVAVTIGILSNIINTIFGLEFMLFIALITLFVLEIITGVWASRIRYNFYTKRLKKEKQNMNNEELTLIMGKLEKYKFSSSRLKRAGAVMGFWMIILFIIWQFTKFDHSPVMCTVFYTIHIIFISYIVGVYLVSVIENVAVISGKRSTFMNLKDMIEKQLTQKK